MTDIASGVAPVMRYHWDSRGWVQEPAQAAVEVPVTLMINGAEYVTAALTPLDIEDWALGYLAGDGIIDRADRVTIFQWRPEDGQIWLRIPGFHPSPAGGSRYLGSCCGQSRPGFFNPAGLAPLDTPLALDPATIRDHFDTLSSWTHGQHSGGLHAAALALKSQLQWLRCDVGRHNALDKVFGAALRAGQTDLTEAVVYFSGRLSAEILWKVRQMGAAAVVSNAAPTSLGVKMADQLGITAIGFVRTQEMSVYSHPERLGLTRI